MSGFVAGIYTVTPSRSGCTFSPASSSVTITSANVAANFTATCGCRTLAANQNVFLDYSGSSSGCHTGGTCNAGEPITFNVTFWLGYDKSCATHTYAWRVDGATVAGSEDTITQQLQGGPHSVAVTVSNGSQAVPIAQTVNVLGRLPTFAFDFSILSIPAPPHSYVFSISTAAAQAQWVWNFGDGASITASGLVQMHTYADDKAYVVTLTPAPSGAVVSHALPAPGTLAPNH
jgi:PKD repeat protein